MPFVVHSPDRITRLCPLGLRLRDMATNQTVTDGLAVLAYPRSDSSRIALATMNRSGVYVFRELPGLRHWENADGTAEFWNSLSDEARRPFVVEVNDFSGRFLSCTFEVRLPHKGLYDLIGDHPASPPQPLASLPSAAVDVPLFSAPSRSVPRGLAALRADICDTIEDQPARWALLELTVAVPLRPPVRGVGVADDRGSLLALFSYPEPNDLLPGSPLHNGLPLAKQEWKISLKAYYHPPPKPPPLPDLGAIFRQQTHPAAQLRIHTALPQEMREATLQFGRELILRTAGAKQSKLILIPAA